MAHKIFNLLTVHFQLLQFGFIITIFLVNPNEVSFTQPMSHKITMINVEYVSHFRRERLFELIKIIFNLLFNSFFESISEFRQSWIGLYLSEIYGLSVSVTYRRPLVLDNRSFITNFCSITCGMLHAFLTRVYF